MIKNKLGYLLLPVVMRPRCLPPPEKSLEGYAGFGGGISDSLPGSRRRRPVAGFRPRLDNDWPRSGRSRSPNLPPEAFMSLPSICAVTARLRRRRRATTFHQQAADLHAFVKQLRLDRRLLWDGPPV